MGGQVYFFLTETDQLIFDTLIRERFTDAVILKKRFSIDDIGASIERKRPLRSGWYYISFQQFLSGLKTEGPDFRGLFGIDLYQSNVIEYGTGACYAEDGIMRISRGRLFYKSKYFDVNNRIITKEAEFEKKAKIPF